MFDSIRDALNKQQKNNNGAKDILRLEKGKTYVVRLIPNLKELEKTWFKYQFFHWTSFATGAYISSISPISWGERDPIAEERLKIYKTGSEEEKEKIKNVRRSERWLMNVYVVSDPTNPENNGTEKKIRFGKQLFSIIDSAINGDDAEEFGSRVFDFSPNGVNLKIKVTDQGGFANYTESRFTSPVDLKLSAEQIAKIYQPKADLSTLVSCKSQDEIKKLFNEHYYAVKDKHDEAPDEAYGDAYGDNDADNDDAEKIRKIIQGIES